MSYVIAAYAVTAITLIAYGLNLARERARLLAPRDRTPRRD